ncbi:endolysin [Vibrio phage D184]
MDEFKNRWPNFSKKELACRCGSCSVDSWENVNFESLDKLQKMRIALGFAMPISSAFRCKNHKSEKSKKEPGAHGHGQGFDIACSHEQALTILECARKFGFTGVGVKQKGGGRFVHVDDMPNEPGKNRPRPHVWSY